MQVAQFAIDAHDHDFTAVGKDIQTGRASRTLAWHSIDRDAQR